MTASPVSPILYLLVFIEMPQYTRPALTEFTLEGETDNKIKQTNKIPQKYLAPLPL